MLARELWELKFTHLQAAKKVEKHWSKKIRGRWMAGVGDVVWEIPLPWITLQRTAWQLSSSLIPSMFLGKQLCQSVFNFISTFLFWTLRNCTTWIFSPSQLGFLWDKMLCWQIPRCCHVIWYCLPTSHRLESVACLNLFLSPFTCIALLIPNEGSWLDYSWPVYLGVAVTRFLRRVQLQLWIFMYDPSSHLRVKLDFEIPSWRY